MGRVSVDNRAALREAYSEVSRIGDELLKALQGAPTAETLDLVDRLLEARDAATQQTIALFQAGDQEEFRQELQALLQQQRAIETQMSQMQSRVQSSSTELQKARSAMGGVRRILKTSPRSRWVNEIL